MPDPATFNAEDCVQICCQQIGRNIISQGLKPYHQDLNFPPLRILLDILFNIVHFLLFEDIVDVCIRA